VRTRIPAALLLVLVLLAGTTTIVSAKQSRPVAGVAIDPCAPIEVQAGIAFPASAERPGTVVLACADDNLEVDHLHWANWGMPLASATGTLRWNDCRPDCAAGHFHAHAETLVVGSLRVPFADTPPLYSTLQLDWVPRGFATSYYFWPAPPGT
jgi:hypothetical protein